MPHPVPLSHASKEAPRFLIAVVLYKMDITEAATFTSLERCALHLSASKIVVWDNSPQAQPQESLAAFRRALPSQVKYVHCPENASLSHVYNAVIRKHSGFDFLMLLDQDSSFSGEFFDRIQAASTDCPDVPLFLPIVESNGRIVSPGDYRLVKGRHWAKKRTGLLSSRGLTAINSGMVIRWQYVKNVFPGYDERLRLYGVDTFFMLKYATLAEHVYVLDYSLRHASALLDASAPVDEKVARYESLFRAWVVLHQNALVRSIAVRLYVLYVGAKECLRHRDLRFLRMAMNAVRA